MEEILTQLAGRQDVPAGAFGNSLLNEKVNGTDNSNIATRNSQANEGRRQMSVPGDLFAGIVFANEHRIEKSEWT